MGNAGDGKTPEWTEKKKTCNKKTTAETLTGKRAGAGGIRWRARGEERGDEERERRGEEGEEGKQKTKKRGKRKREEGRGWG